jgi:hypothetical protein
VILPQICDDCNNADSFPPKKMAQLYVAIKAIDPFHVVIGAPWARPWSLYQYGDDAGQLSLDYAQVENYHADPARHAGWDERIRAGMYWEPIANSPPAYILEGDDPDSGRANGRTVLPPALESTLSWLGAIEFGAANVVNFVIEPQLHPGQGDYKALNMPSHINAQGDYARAARNLLPALLPDLTDPRSQPMELKVTKTSHCLAPATLPAERGRPAVDFSKISNVVVKGFRQPWREPSTNVSSFCAFVIVVNLCAAPSSYTVAVGDEVPAAIIHAQHHYDTNYNVSIEVQPVASSNGQYSATSSVNDGDPASRTFADIVPGYGTSILRLGCPGWRQDCDGTGRVC